MHYGAFRGTCFGDIFLHLFTTGHPLFDTRVTKPKECEMLNASLRSFFPTTFRISGSPAAVSSSSNVTLASPSFSSTVPLIRVSQMIKGGCSSPVAPTLCRCAAMHFLVSTFYIEAFLQARLVFTCVKLQVDWDL